MPAFADGTYTPGAAASRITAPVNSDIRQLMVSFNAMLAAQAGILAAHGGAEVPLTTATLSRGTTVTLASTASVISINGVAAVVAALTAQAFGALGTIPQNKYGVIKVQRVLAGTCTFVSAAANYTSGYDTEALAVAAMPATTADRVAIGYVVVMSTNAAGWVAGTDALQGGTGGNPATYTNYVSFDGVADTTNPNWVAARQIANLDGDVLTSLVG